MDIRELVISDPDSIIASIPFVIGFTPHDSLVVLWLSDGRLRLAMRLDLPPAEASVREWIDAVMQHRASSDEVIICVLPPVGGRARDADGELCSRDLVSELLARLGETRCQVRDALLTVGDRWWSYLCQEPECCPTAGVPLDTDVVQSVAARFVLAGVAWLPDREAVLAICAAEPLRQAANRALVRAARRAWAARLPSAGGPGADLETWRDESIALVMRSLISDSDVDSCREADLLLALCDVRVRDTVLWDLAHVVGHDARRAFDRAAFLLRGAPCGVIAPIGSVTALLAWLIGDGVRAAAALDRVRAENPAYPLAELLGRSIAAGLSPERWLEMMSGLGREACRGAAA
jgi:hypothetical protein